MINQYSKTSWVILALALILSYSHFAFAKTPSHKKSAKEHIEKKVRHWTCSMHPEVKSSKPGKCSICGMKLMPVHEEEHSDSEKDQHWTCSMHPEVKSSEPGKCSACGMKLTPAHE